MASYLSKIELFFYGLSSRRRCVKISETRVIASSSSSSSSSSSQPQTLQEKRFKRSSNTNNKQQNDHDNNNDHDQSNDVDKLEDKENRKPNISATSNSATALPAKTETPTTTTTTTISPLLSPANDHHTKHDGHHHARHHDEPLLLATTTQPQELQGRRSGAICPSLLYTLALVCCAALWLAAPCQCNLIPMAAADNPNAGPNLVRSLVEYATNRPVLRGAAGGSGGSRWAYVPNTPEMRDQTRYPSRPVQGMGIISRAVQRLRNRMGSRNSIRVHNAFRDLAWQILARLSMPTPVIYELRRQHFYSAEEEMMNDSLYNKNTTKTIRSKRSKSQPTEGRSLMALSGWSAGRRSDRRQHADNKRDDDDDDDPQSLRDRLRSRLDDLVNLSRRSLFGRVVRIPSLFPFKRHENSQITTKNNSPDKQQRSSGARSRRRSQRSRKDRKELDDKQRIVINGKKYFVDDDGELKQLPA